VEKFVAPVPAGRQISAEVHLRYSYAPQLLSREEISIDIATERFP
jgi:hypothetical protein